MEYTTSKRMTSGSLDSLDLQRILTEEKLRAEEHRNNYQLLKVEHNKLQAAYNKLENELIRVTDSQRRTTERDRLEFLDAQKRLTEMQAELDTLRQNQVTEQRMEMLKLKVADEMEATYRERFSRTHSESESCRTELNRLRQEFSFLKAEYEHQQVEHSRIIEEIRMVHEAEVNNLRQEREQLLERLAVPEETERLKALHRENAQLNAKIKSVAAELEELQSEREFNCEQLEKNNRGLAKQLSEAESSCRQLEVEKESLRHQIEAVNKELAELRATLNQSSQRTYDLEKQNTQLKHKIEEVTHKGQLDISQIQLETAKYRGEVERQRDDLVNRYDDLQYELQLAQAKSNQLEAALLDREKEMSRREAAVREEEWDKLRQLEQEKADIESQLAVAERKVIEQETLRNAQLEKAEERARQAEMDLRSSEVELTNLRRRCDTAESNFRRLQEANQSSGDDAARYEADILELTRKLADSDAIRSERDEIERELYQVRSRLEDINRRNENNLHEKEAVWQKDKEELNKNIRKLDMDLKQKQTQLENLEQQMKRKKVKYEKYFETRKHQLQLTKAKCEELQIENDILRKNVPYEEYNKVKRELKELKRRHLEFRNVILQPSSYRGSFPLDGSALPINDEERRHHESIRQLKENLDSLGVRQQEQMAELLSDGNSSSRPLSPLQPEDRAWGPMGDN